MASGPSTTSLRESIEATARAFLSAFEEGVVQDDTSIINRDVTADCTRHMHPASVPQAFGLPTDYSFDTTTFQQAYAKDIKVLEFRNNTMANLVIDTDARRAAFTSIAEVHGKGGGSCSAEQAWVLYFNEDGSKVKKVIEFCDKDAIVRMAKIST